MNFYFIIILNLFIIFGFKHDIYESVSFKDDNLYCKMTSEGQDYIGVLAVTVGGKSCIPWEFQGKKISHCRNPTRDRNGPWCYTDISNSTDYCDIKYCSEYFCLINCATYFVNTSVTKSGKNCINWSLTKEKPWNFPDNSLVDAKNHCRNPSSNPGGLWCYINLTKGEYCEDENMKRFDKSECESTQLLSGRYMLGLINDGNCQKFCVWTITYNDSTPKLKMKEEVRFISIDLYNEMVADFYIDFLGNDSLDFTFRMRENRYNESICLNNVIQPKYNGSPSCIFRAVCIGHIPESEINLYLLLDQSEDWCMSETGFTSTKNKSNCQAIFLELEPIFYNYEPTQLTITVIKGSSEKIFTFYQISSLKLFRGVPIPAIYRIQHSMSACTEKIVDSLGVTFKVNFENCCPCGCLTTFSYIIFLKGAHRHIRKSYDIIFDADITCMMDPQENTIDKPIVLNTNNSFRFNWVLPPRESLVLNIPSIHCVHTVNVLRNSFELLPHNCCNDICIFNLAFKTLLLSSKERVYGNYYFIITIGQRISFHPDLVNIYRSDKFIRCKLDVPLDYTFVIMQLAVATGWANISQYNITRFQKISRFTLVCIFYIYHQPLNQYISLFFINRTFLLISRFDIKIFGTYFIRPGKSIICFTSSFIPSYSVSLTFLIEKSPIDANVSNIKMDDDKAVLSMIFSSNAVTGFYNVTCIGLLNDSGIDGKVFALKKMAYLEFIVTGVNGEYIQPIAYTIHTKSVLKCFDVYKSDYSNIYLKIVNLLSNSTIIHKGNEFHLPYYLRTAVYEISCYYLYPITVINYIKEKRIIIGDPLAFYPNIGFYVSTNNIDIKCELNPDITLLNIVLKWRIIYDDTDDNYTILFPHLITILKIDRHMFHNISCQLLWLQNGRKDLTLVEIKKTVIVLKEFQIYFDSKVHYLLNETLPCHINSTFLEIRPHLYEIKWSSNKDLKFNQIYRNNKHMMSFDPLTYPGNYTISCKMIYDDFDWIIHKKMLTVTGIFYLTGISTFRLTSTEDIVVPNDLSCCIVSAAVPVLVNIIVYNTSVFGTNEACFRLPTTIITYIGVIFCNVSYNRFYELKQKSVVYLGTPKSLFIIPDQPKMGSDIICFPYPSVFEYEFYKDVNMTFNWSILESPKVDAELDVDRGNLSFYSTQDNILILSQEVAIFGKYILNCRCNVTFRNMTLKLELTSTYFIKYFGEDLLIFYNTMRASIFFVSFISALFLIAYHCMTLMLTFHLTIENQKEENLKSYLQMSGIEQKYVDKPDRRLSIFIFDKSNTSHREFLTLYHMLEMRILKAKAPDMKKNVLLAPSIQFRIKRMNIVDGFNELGSESLTHTPNLIDQIFENAFENVAVKYRDTKKSLFIVTPKAL